MWHKHTDAKFLKQFPGMQLEQNPIHAIKLNDIHNTTHHVFKEDIETLSSYLLLMLMHAS